MNRREYREARRRIIKNGYVRFAADRHWRRIMETASEPDGEAVGGLVPSHLNPDGDHFQHGVVAGLSESLLGVIAEDERLALRRLRPASSLFNMRPRPAGVYRLVRPASLWRM